ncbi:MAG: cytochrome C [Alphaproteobacteria bacterium]|nr:cytochrome C [Alphaproteobacteria bacterium]
MRRRGFLRGLAAAPVASTLAAPAIAQAAARVVVVGGGFAGATCARRLAAAGIATTLVEPATSYLACPFSNLVVAGMRDLEEQRFGFDGLRAAGVAVAAQAASVIDPLARRIALADGIVLAYDRLVLAPGVEIRLDALPGYDAAATEAMPHAWRAGPQTTLLRAQLEAMDDGGVVAMSIPANPYRCPPGPYERASLVAHYLSTRKPRSRLLLLDAKDGFSKQRLFEKAWRELYPGIVEWVPLSRGGRVIEVQARERVLVAEFERHRVDVANVIPPQRAAPIAREAGVADRSGWCPVDPATFESRLQPGIHVIGDAAVMGAMPKSAFAANAQAKACAEVIAALLAGRAPAEPRLINTCYSLVAPGTGISVAGVYRPAANGLLAEIPGSGGTSPLDAPPEDRRLEASHAEAWFAAIAAETYG